MVSYSQGIQKMKRDSNEIISIMDISCTYENIYVFPGKLSQNDIVLKYKKNGTRRRTPKHIHFVIDLLIKKEHNDKLVKSFIDTLLIRWESIQGLNQRDINILNKYNELNTYGEYSIEFLLHFGELLMLQEKTNMPGAYMFKKVMESIKDDKDIYSIVSTATHNGR